MSYIQTEAYAEGAAEGAAKATMSNMSKPCFDLQNLIQYTAWTLEQAMEALNVPESERKEYIELLNQQQ